MDKILCLFLDINVIRLSIWLVGKSLFMSTDIESFRLISKFYQKLKREVFEEVSNTFYTTDDCLVGIRVNYIVVHAIDEVCACEIFLGIVNLRCSDRKGALSECKRQIIVWNALEFRDYLSEFVYGVSIRYMLHFCFQNYTSQVKLGLSLHDWSFCMRIPQI